MASATEVLQFYFQDLLFQHIEYQQQFRIYGARVPSLYQKDARYVFAIIDTTKGLSVPNIGNVRLFDLPWISLQTRLVSRDKDKYRRLLPTQAWTLNSRPHDARLKIKSREKDKSKYESDDATLAIEVLHASSSKSIYQFHSTMMLSTAVETFQTIFTRMQGADTVTNRRTLLF